MRIGHIELFVTDPQQSLAFYRDVLGFSVTTIQDDKYVWLKLGDTEILLRPGEPKDRSLHYDQTSTGLVLYTDNLPTTKSTLEANGLEFVQLPEGCAAFTDPDGHWFQLVDPKHS